MDKYRQLLSAGKSFACHHFLFHLFPLVLSSFFLLLGNLFRILALEKQLLSFVDVSLLVPIFFAQFNVGLADGTVHLDKKSFTNKKKKGFSGRDTEIGHV